MPERLIQTIRTDDPGDEDIAATRERLKAGFPPGAVRRMTQLGMLMGAILDELAPRRDDAIIYATQYGEGRTLESFLDSFPAASPTGFQTSIHPGAVQQGMIRRARPVGEFFPMSGSDWLAGHSVLAAFLSPAPRVLLCGGEERGTWLTAIDGASTRTFAHGMSLVSVSKNSAGSAPPPAGRITLEPDTGAAAPLAPGAWFDLLHARKNFSGIIAPGWRTTLTWR
jgi:hypothetical protein